MRPLLLLAGLLATPAFLHGQEHKLDIRLTPEVGAAVEVRKKETARVTTKLTSPEGESKDIVQALGSAEKYVESVQARADGRATAFERKYLEATTREEGKDKPRSFAERTVRFAWKDGRYGVHLPRPALPAADTEELARSAKVTDAIQRMLPARAVRVGGTWALPKEALADFTPGPLDLAKSSGEGKLVKVYDKGGRKYAVVELKMDCALKAMAGLEFSPPAALKVTARLDASLAPGTVEAQWKADVALTGKGMIAKTGRKYRFEMVAESKAESTRTPVK